MPEAKPGGWPETFLGMGWEMDKSMSLPWEEGVLCLLGEDGPLLCAQMDYFLVQGGGVSCLCRVRSHPPSSGTGRPILGRNLSCLIVNWAPFSFSPSPLCLLSSFLPRPAPPPSPIGWCQTHSAAQAGLEVPILLPQSPKNWVAGMSPYIQRGGSFSWGSWDLACALLGLSLRIGSSPVGEPPQGS